jgi:peptidoglycan/xylan/chitin deacetylase (PgdA/CDA1 family)
VRHTVTVLLFLAATLGRGQAVDHRVIVEGGVVRSDTTHRALSLIFSGHEFAQDGDSIAAVLRRHRIPASFFFTGDFYRNAAFAPLVQRLRADGHYLGAHSDRHLLYASWERRDSTLVSREAFTRDLWDNLEAMRPYGVPVQEARFFLPPYEWYNRQIAGWCRDSGIVLVNFSPGTYSNADYTTPDMGTRYVPTDTIFERILRYAASRPSGLNGFHLLLHIGTHPSRTDRFIRRLDELVTELTRRGYQWKRIDAWSKEEGSPQ